MHNLIKAANYYLEISNIDKEVQIDLLFISKKENKPIIHHIPKAIYPDVNQF